MLLTGVLIGAVVGTLLASAVWWYLLRSRERTYLTFANPPDTDDAALALTDTAIARPALTDTVIAHPVLTDTAIAHLAGDLLDAAVSVDSSKLRRRLLGAIRSLHVEIVRPEEDDPLAPGLHVCDQTVPTADPTRHGTIAGVLLPGLRAESGAVIRPAEVQVHVFGAGERDTLARDHHAGGFGRLTAPPGSSG